MIAEMDEAHELVTHHSQEILDITQTLSFLPSGLQTAWKASLWVSSRMAALCGFFANLDLSMNGRSMFCLALRLFFSQHDWLKLGLGWRRFARDMRWSETGDRYIIALFRDYVFHQVDEHGNPVVNLTHVLTCLNKVRVIHMAIPLWLSKFNAECIQCSLMRGRTSALCSCLAMSKVVWSSVTRRSSRASNRHLGMFISTHALSSLAMIIILTFPTASWQGVQEDHEGGARMRDWWNVCLFVFWDKNK